MKENKPKLTLELPVTYQIKVPGVLDQQWSDWYERMTVAVERIKDGVPVTTVTITLDQVTLQGILRHLYSLGLPSISVICVDFKGK